MQPLKVVPWPLQPFLGHRAGGDHRGRSARERAPAAARIADAVLVPVGIVGMAGTETARDVAVVLAALVGVLRISSAIGVPVVRPS